MKTSIRLILGCVAAAMVLTLLPACEQSSSPPAEQPKAAVKPAEPAKPAEPVDTGLVPDKASTGNPPLIPHVVAESDGGKECLACHKDGKNGAPKNSDWHATLTDCRQCHVVEDNVDMPEFKTQY